MGSFFKLNPKVDDLPERLSLEMNGIRLMVLGGVKKGGAGCICPESTLLKNLVRHIVLARDEVVVLDMEAGLEHLGRGTAMAVDRLIVVVEPGRRSIETAQQIRRLAGDIGLKKLSLVGNKIRSDRDREFLLSQMPGFQFPGVSCPLTDRDHRGGSGRPCPLRQETLQGVTLGPRNDRPTGQRGTDWRPQKPMKRRGDYGQENP